MVPLLIILTKALILKMSSEFRLLESLWQESWNWGWWKMIKLILRQPLLVLEAQQRPRFSLLYCQISLKEATRNFPVFLIVVTPVNRIFSSMIACGKDLYLASFCICFGSGCMCVMERIHSGFPSPAPGLGASRCSSAGQLEWQDRGVPAVITESRQNTIIHVFVNTTTNRQKGLCSQPTE